MKQLEAAPEERIDARFEKNRQMLIERMWLGLLVLVLIAIPITTWRASESGWQNMNKAQLALGFGVVAAFFLRNRLSPKVKGAVPVALIFIGGSMGLFGWGIASTGFWWLVMVNFLVGLIFSYRTAILTYSFTALLIVIAGVGFLSGVLRPGVDLNEWAASLPAWLLFMMAATIVPSLVLMAIGAFQKTILELLDEVHSKSAQLEQLATHDQLTRLPLMHLATDRFHVMLSRAQRENKRVALFFVDLDGFKEVNDTYGHEAGDHVLTEIAGRLRQALRDEDTIARIGGDEFLVILGDLPDCASAGPVADKLLSVVPHPVQYEGHALSVSASIGIAVFPEHAQDLVNLRRAADNAMYQAKKAGKNAFKFAV